MVENRHLICWKRPHLCETGYDISLLSQWEYIYMHAIMQYSSNLSRQKHNLKIYSGSVQSNHWRIQKQSADIPKF